MKIHLDGANYFAVDSIQVIAEGELVNHFELEQYVFCRTIIYLRSLAFKSGELNKISSESRQIPLERNYTVCSRNGTQN